MVRLFFYNIFIIIISFTLVIAIYNTGTTTGIRTETLSSSSSFIQIDESEYPSLLDMHRQNRQYPSKLSAMNSNANMKCSENQPIPIKQMSPKDESPGPVKKYVFTEEQKMYF